MLAHFAPQLLQLQSGQCIARDEHRVAAVPGWNQSKAIILGLNLKARPSQLDLWEPQGERSRTTCAANSHRISTRFPGIKIHRKFEPGLNQINDRFTTIRSMVLTRPTGCSTHTAAILPN